MLSCTQHVLTYCCIASAIVMMFWRFNNRCTNFDPAYLWLCRYVIDLHQWFWDDQPKVQQSGIAAIEESDMPPKERAALAKLKFT